MTDISILYSESFTVTTVSYTGDPYTLVCMMGYHVTTSGSLIQSLSGELICASNNTWINPVSCAGNRSFNRSFFLYFRLSFDSSPVCLFILSFVQFLVGLCYQSRDHNILYFCYDYFVIVANPCDLSSVKIAHSESFTPAPASSSYTGDPFSLQCMLGYHVVMVTNSLTTSVTMVTQTTTGQLICALNETWINPVSCQGKCLNSLFFL